MKIIKAKKTGMCGGVRRALDIVNRVQDPQEFSICGELVHNEAVLDEIDKKGFHRVAENDRSRGLRKKILITAHGMSDRKRGRLCARGRIVVDATCPLVKKLHDTAKEYRDNGYFIVLAGKRGHAEVKGITGDLSDFCVVESAEEVRVYDRKKIAVLSQTTSTVEQALMVLNRVRDKNQGSLVEYADTICPSTRIRQDSVRMLCTRIDILIAVGGKKSNNTLQLCGIAADMGVIAKHVQKPDDLNPRWFVSTGIVGIAGGASTPDEQVNAVQARIRIIDENFRHLNRLMEDRISTLQLEQGHKI